MPQKRRPRNPKDSSARHPNPQQPTASHPTTSDRASQPPPERSPAPPPTQPDMDPGHSAPPNPWIRLHLSSSPPPQPPPEHRTEPGPSAPPSPCTTPPPLPLGWTQADFYILSYHMYKNTPDFDDSAEWWGRIIPHLPHKNVQELRLFSFLYMRSCGLLPRGPGPEVGPLEGDTAEVAPSEGDNEEPMEWESTPVIENPKVSGPPKRTGSPSLEAVVLRQYFDWTLEESRRLLKLIERKPSLLMRKEGWKKLSGHFPGKRASDIGRHIAMVQLAAVFMGGVDSILVNDKVQNFSAGREAVIGGGDQKPSTFVQAGVDHREQGVSSPDSPASTGGRPSSPSTSGRGGRRRK